MELNGMYYVQQGLYTAHFELVNNMKKSKAIQLDSLVASQTVQELQGLQGTMPDCNLTGILDTLKA